MAEFTYNNAKNISIDYTTFRLNYGLHLRAYYKKDVYLNSQSKSVDKIAIAFAS